MLLYGSPISCKTQPIKLEKKFENKLRPYGAAVRPDVYECAEVCLYSVFEPINDLCERHTFVEHKKQ